MRSALRNAAPTWHAEHDDYFARLTGDVPHVAALVDCFCDPAERYPVVAITSELLTTGIDSSKTTPSTAPRCPSLTS